MSIIQGYIGRAIIYTTLLLMLLLMGVESFIILIRHLDEIGEGTFGLSDAFMQVVYGLPYGLYKFFPMAAMLGSLLGLGQLASHSELIVMRTSGVSTLQIIWAVIKAALLLVLFVSVVGELVGPYTQREAISSREVAKSGGQSLRTVHGTWIRSHHRFIHIAKIKPGKELAGVTIYQFDGNHRLLSASYAKRAHYENDQWTLFDIQRSLIHADNAVSIEKADQATLDLAVDPKLLGVTKIKPREMNLIELHNYIEFQRASGQASGEYELNFWQRIFQPLTTCVMMFLVIPVIFGSLRSMPIGVRLLIGAGIGFSFYLMDSLFGPFSLVYQFPPALAALFPSMVFLIAGMFLLRRMR